MKDFALDPKLKVVAEVAKDLGLTERRIQQMIAVGDLAARKATDLEELALRKTGRIQSSTERGVWLIQQEVVQCLKQLRTGALTETTRSKVGYPKYRPQSKQSKLTTASKAKRSALKHKPLWKVPITFTSLIGREQDVATIGALLLRPDVRLLTLLGVGGIGKTRLSIQVANQLREHFNDGICFVGLAPISDPSLVISSIAHELGLQEAGAQSLVETVKTWLRDKQFLLLLDNFEQIVSAAPLLEDLLTACPRLVILVTSREVLRLSAEYLFPVPPLSLPDLAQHPDHEQLSQYAAVSLFLYRAQVLKPDFMLTPANTRAIAEICVRMDGLPLAIELAAARIRLLPPQALLARLSQRLQALTSRSRTLPERQLTLHNTLKWSYDLLNEQEQCLFRRLSVFVGGCTLEAVEVVCAALDGADTVAPVLNDVDSLIDKSLAQQTEQEGEEPRLVMLETVREYGQECLRENREEESCHRAHAQYYLTLAEMAELHLHEAQQFIWLKRLNREQENFRAALQWFIKHTESEHALRLSGALSWYWYMRGYWGECLSWLLTALQLSNTEDHTVARARVLGWAGILTLYQGNSTAEVHTLLEESIALHKVLEDTRGLAFAIMNLGEVYRVQEDYLTAHSLMEESVDLCRQAGDKWMLAVALGDLAEVIWAQGNAPSARTLLEEAWALVQEVGDTWSETRVNTILADWARAQGDYSQAATHYQKALSVAQQTGDVQYIAQSLAGLGDMARRQDDNAKALELYSQGLTIAREFGLQLSTCCRLLCGLGDIAQDEGDGIRAATLYREGLSLGMKDDYNKLGVVHCLLGLARIARRSRQFWRAAQLLSATEAQLNIDRELDPLDRAEYERDVADIRAYLGEEAFMTACAQGRSMSPEQALAAQEPMMMPTTAPAEPSSVPHAVKSPTYLAGLTAREVEVLRLVAQGLSDAQVAEQLIISPRTVNGHLRSIYNKINVNSRSAATRYAMEHSLI